MHVKRLYIIILTKYEIFPTLNFLYTKIYGNITKKKVKKILILRYLIFKQETQTIKNKYNK